jgi:hypothetical protein
MPKPARPPRPVRPIVEEPVVLILHEKHGGLHFHIPDEPTLFKVALDIVIKRLKAGHWYLDPKDYVPENPGMTKEQAEALPPGPIRNSAVSAVSSYKNALSQHSWILEGWENVQKAVKEKDGRLAWRVLRDHSDGEYQRVSLEKYCDSYYE